MTSCARLWLLRCLACSVLIGFLGRVPASASADKWTEYNLGPFYVSTDSDTAADRFDLTQLEQTRWVLSGLLEIKELNATWPFRVLVTKSNPPSNRFTLHNGYYLLVIAPGSALPLGQVARLFLEANTPRLPDEVETGIAQLFDTLKANGSRVTWGGAPAHADLAFARMQLFATKFEYSASFHILLSSLRNGSTLHVAERNAFGQDYQALEQEAASRLASKDWQAVAVSGRPLDPKRDFGDHSLDGTIARLYAASTLIPADMNAAEPILKASLNEGGQVQALALESLAEIDAARHEKSHEYRDDAMHAGSKSAEVYMQAAADLPPDQALPLLKKAAQLNPRWSEPIFAQAQATQDLNQREILLKQAIQLYSRSPDYWVALAQTQIANHHSLAAQSSWARAEEAAPDEAKRKAIQDMQDSMEATRLDEQEARSKHDKDAAILADQRAQQAEQDRIHAAEERANQASAAVAEAAGKSADVVDWDSLTKTQKSYGNVVMVDCRSDYVRVAVRDLRGKTRQLLYRDPDHKTFSCDNRPEKRQIVVTFRPHDDAAHGTDGDIVDVAWR